MTLLIGPASLLESDDRPAWWTPPGRPHRLEALVGNDNGDGTLTIHHYFCGQHRPDNPWLCGDAVTTQALGPAALAQRGRPGTRDHELVAHIPESGGVREYAWSVNDARDRRWRRLGLVEVEPQTPPSWDGPDDAVEWGAGTVLATATARTRLRSGWIQALVQVDHSLYHLHRQARGASVRWVRHACLRLDDREPFSVAAKPSIKIAQVSGERDTQPSPGRGGRGTLSSSESRSGIRGTDLGVRIDHDGRTFLLFGDTHWRRPWLATRDALAEVVDVGSELPEVTFHGSPLRVRGDRTTMREYDVPLDAFSLDGALFAFFSSDHFRNAQVMGRSVLTRAEPSSLAIDPSARRRPLRFRHLGTVSRHRFINVSAQRVGDHLLLWGSGGYRADELRLARVDLTAPGVAEGLLDGSGAEFLAALEYWAGPTVEPVEIPAAPIEPVETPHHPDDGQIWSSAEADARPLHSPGAHGEVSVRWVPQLGRYLMLTMSGPEDPIGAAVVLRTAPQAWGPWSARLKLFDWVAAGMSFGDASQRFIRSSSAGDDPVGDAVFRGQANATGAAYAPTSSTRASRAANWCCATRCPLGTRTRWY